MSELHRLKVDIIGLRSDIKTSQEHHNDGTLATAAKQIAKMKAPGKGIKMRRHLKGHLKKVYDLHWSADSRHIVSAAADGNLLIWDVCSKNKQMMIRTDNEWTNSCAYSPSGSFVANGDLNNICYVHPLQGRTFEYSPTAQELRGHTGWISGCRFVSDEEMLTCSGDTTCALWDIDSGTQKTIFKSHDGDVLSLEIVEEGRTFVTGSCDNTAKIWDMRTGQCTQTFWGHSGDVNSVSVHPSGLAIGSASDDRTCKLFDLRADQEVAAYSLLSITSEVHDIAFSRSGRILCAAYDDGCRLWDVATENCVEQFEGHGARVSCVDIAPDGLAICTGSWDTMLKVWS
ncbi:hypothetical protein L596_023840 [Steinernema carpocapsae]|nr:hypothetical protein L596_023840 [Steinernema carpocapsae]